MPARAPFRLTRAPAVSYSPRLKHPPAPLGIAVSHSPPLPYCCPDETQGISRAVHLGRLASFYPACRACPHAGDTLTLSPRNVRQLASVQRRASPASLFHEEGIAGSFLNELGPAEARHAAAALAMLLTRDAQSDSAPEVVLGCDGRSAAAEIGAAVSDALRQAGCVVVDAGFTTSGSVAAAIGRLQCGGGVFIGRGDGGPQHIGLSFFGSQAIPFSAGGRLDALERLWHAGVERLSRRSGSVRRYRADATLLADLTPYFHALRPLRLVLDTTSLPLRQQLARLAQPVSLEILPCGQAGARVPGATDASSILANRVRQTGAHFGLWIDGDGERCRLIDEQGSAVSSERLTILLLRHFQEQSADATLVVEEPTISTIRAALGSNASLHAAPATREGVARAMQTCGAVAAGGISDRCWFAAPVPVACALRTVAHLLTIFSRSDRPVSEVLTT